MEFHDDFKILQLTDLHLGIENDLVTQLSVIKNAINESNPDLIVLTGDNFMYATKSVVENLVSTIVFAIKILTLFKDEKKAKTV